MPEIFDTKKHLLMKNVIQNMAQNGLRTICVAYKDYINSKSRASTETEVIFCFLFT